MATQQSDCNLPVSRPIWSFTSGWGVKLENNINPGMKQKWTWVRSDLCNSTLTVSLYSHSLQHQHQHDITHLSYSRSLIITTYHSSISSKLASTRIKQHQCTGCFFHWASPKKLKYGKRRLGESTLTQIVLDTSNLAQINFSVLRTFRGRTSEKTACMMMMKIQILCKRQRRRRASFTHPKSMI